MDIYRSRQRSVLEVLRPASIVLFVFLLFSLRAGSFAAAGRRLAPGVGALDPSQRAGARFAPRALGRLTPLVVGTAIGAVVISAFALWVGPVKVDLALLAFMTAAGPCAFGLLRGAHRAHRGTSSGSRGRCRTERGAARRDVGTDPEGRFALIGVASETAAPLPGVRSTYAIEDISETLVRESPDLVVLAVERGRPQVFSQLLDAAGAGFRLVGLPDFYEHAFGRVPVRHLSAAWFMSVLHLYQPAYSRFAKRFFDVVVVAFTLILIAPLLAAIALMLSVSRGPIIFRAAAAW